MREEDGVVSQERETRRQGGADELMTRDRRLGLTEREIGWRALQRGDCLTGLIGLEEASRTR